jgi:hypothetical protein
MKASQKLRFVVDGVQFYQRFREIVDVRLYTAAEDLERARKQDKRVKGIVQGISGKNIQVEYA